MTPPREDEAPDGRVSGISRPGGRRTPGDDAELPGEVAAFLKELASTLGKFAMYPDGHPTLEPAVSELSERLAALLARRESVDLRVRRDRIRVDGADTDPDNPLLSGLAGRLHDHQLSTVSIRSGVGRDEMAGLLSALAREPRREGDPLGLAGDDDRWEHIRVTGRRYDPLRLESGVPPDTAPDVSRSDDEPPVGSRLAGEDLLETSPAEIAGAVESRLAEEDLDRVVAYQLLRMTERLEETGDDTEAAREKLSRVVLSLPSDVLAALMERLESDRGEEELLLAAARSMEVEATLKLVQAAASRRDEGEVIAEWLLELVLKLSMYGREDRARPPSRTREVDDLIDRILESWDLEDPRPPVYQTALHRMARNPPGDAGLPEQRARSIFISPERVLKMGLELDESADYVRDAAEQMLGAERFDDLAEMLDEVPADHGVASELWDRMSTPGMLERVLAADPPGFALAQRLVEREGVEMAPPLLEALGSPRSESRVYWRKVFNLLVGIGDPVLPLIPDRLDDDRWYVRRNMLSLLRELSGWPDGFSPLPYLDDEDPRVRAEALALALEAEGVRDAAVEAGLRDTNPRVVTLALSAAESDLPPSAVPGLAELVTDAERPTSYRIRAARLLARADAPEALRVLLDVVWRRKWLFWRDIAPASPLVEAAVSALRTGWREEPDARRALEAAAASGDARLERAARGGEEETA